MRIGYIVPTLGIGGGVNVICEHANYLHSLGAEVFFVNMGPEREVGWRPNACPIYGADELDIWEKIHVRKNNIIVCTGWQTVYPLLKGGWTADNYVYFVQSDETRFFDRGSLLESLAFATYGLPFHYQTEARWIVEFLRLRGHDAKYIRNGVDRRLFSPKEAILPRRPGRLRVLVEGPIDVPFKRVREAYAATQGIDVDVWLVSSAGRPDPWMQPELFLEKVPLERMANVYSSCDVLMKLSSVEGMFGPPLEMMACGGTAITSDVTGHDEFMRHGENGFVCRGGNVTEARRYLQQIVDDPKLLERMKASGLSTAESWGWAEPLQSLADWYGDLAASASHRSSRALVDFGRAQVWPALFDVFERSWSPLPFVGYVSRDFRAEASNLLLVVAEGWCWPSEPAQFIVDGWDVIEVSLQAKQREDVVEAGLVPIGSRPGFRVTLLCRARSTPPQTPKTLSVRALTTTGDSITAVGSNHGCVDEVVGYAGLSVRFETDGTRGFSNVRLGFRGSVQELYVSRTAAPAQVQELDRVELGHRVESMGASIGSSDHWALLAALEDSRQLLTLFLPMSTTLDSVHCSGGN